MPKGLKLFATETEDVEILSAALEGMITSPGEMSFHKSSRAFTIMGSRFMWEVLNDDANTPDSWYRIRSGLHLSTNVIAGSDAEIHLNFAGGGTLLLKAECINLTLTDTGDAWQTKYKPQHEGIGSSSDQENE